jgi:hypothetical protein
MGVKNRVTMFKSRGAKVPSPGPAPKIEHTRPDYGQIETNMNTLKTLIDINENYINSLSGYIATTQDDINDNIISTTATDIDDLGITLNEINTMINSLQDSLSSTSPVVGKPDGLGFLIKKIEDQVETFRTSKGTEDRRVGVVPAIWKVNPDAIKRLDDFISTLQPLKTSAKALERQNMDIGIKVTKLLKNTSKKYTEIQDYDAKVAAYTTAKSAWDAAVVAATSGGPAAGPEPTAVPKPIYTTLAWDSKITDGVNNMETKIDDISKLYKQVRNKLTVLWNPGAAGIINTKTTAATTTTTTTTGGPTTTTGGPTTTAATGGPTTSSVSVPVITTTTTPATPATPDEIAKKAAAIINLLGGYAGDVEGIVKTKGADTIQEYLDAINNLCCSVTNPSAAAGTPPVTPPPVTPPPVTPPPVTPPPVTTPAPKPFHLATPLAALSGLATYFTTPRDYGAPYLFNCINDLYNILNAAVPSANSDAVAELLDLKNYLDTTKAPPQNTYLPVKVYTHLYKCLYLLSRDREPPLAEYGPEYDNLEIIIKYIRLIINEIDIDKIALANSQGYPNYDLIGGAKKKGLRRSRKAERVHKFEKDSEM